MWLRSRVNGLNFSEGARKKFYCVVYGSWLLTWLKNQPLEPSHSNLNAISCVIYFFQINCHKLLWLLKRISVYFFRSRHKFYGFRSIRLVRGANFGRWDRQVMEEWLGRLGSQREDVYRKPYTFSMRCGLSRSLSYLNLRRGSSVQVRNVNLQTARNYAHVHPHK